MLYSQFTIGRFRGVRDVTISLVKNDLVLLLGLNESGKTTILRGIEAFDFRNDPDSDKFNDFNRSIRNKSDTYSNELALITAVINVDQDIALRKTHSLYSKSDISKTQLVEAFLQKINQEKKITITRVFPFKQGNPQKPYYRIESDHPLAQDFQYADEVAREIISMCPFIIYFEDFTDRIPERIYVTEGNANYNSDWFDIIDGLFYNTDSRYSIKSFKNFFNRNKPRPDDAKTVLKRVNKTLNSVFTKKWQELSGVQDIENTELIENFGNQKYFEIKITDTDGTTYSVDERSKGALWYLAFLMKTEFRRKKIRKDSGKPVFLIDEPASNLHSTAQTNMIGDFKKLVEDTSVIYTTHSQYLISLENIRNTYIIRRNGGLVNAVLWSDYIREEPSIVSHYQPLANCLQLVPNSLVIPWEKALITEGVSDKDAFELMYKVVFSKKSCDFVIYPGTSAYNLGTLISLNLGWKSEFRVILDGDVDGKQKQEDYIEQFNLDDTVVQTLSDGKKIENCFSKEEQLKLYEYAMGKEHNHKVSKKEFQKVLAILNGNSNIHNEIKRIFSDQTIDYFMRLFNSIKF
jgi:energy-coupling factor transporter ATP-binding protein EcfA2